MNKVVDMKGRTLDPSKPIMGGTQEGAALRSGIMKATGAKPKSLVDAAIDNVSMGFVKGDRKYNAQLVAEDLAGKKFGKEFYDLDQRQQMDLYDEALKGLSEDFAQGGRAGFKLGSIDKARRAFLKTVGAAGAGITALKTGLLGLGKEAAPMVEAAKETVTKAPDYFFALVDKIKRFGKSVDDAVADKRLEQTYRYKNYELRENAFGEPGETIVTKTDDMGEFGYKEESMRFKKGGQTEDGFIPDEYEEVTVRPDAEGKLKDVEDGIEDVSEIIEEVSKSTPPIKKAGGGIARMLGDIMHPKDRAQMMAYLTRPAMARGGRIGFDSGGEALRRKYLQQDYKKYGKDKLEKATQKMLSLGEEDFIKPGRTIPKLDAPSLKDVKNYEDLDSQLKKKIKTKLDKYGKYVGEAEARILGRKDKTLTDKKTLPDRGAKIVKEGGRIVDINFADPEIKKQFLEEF